MTRVPVICLSVLLVISVSLLTPANAASNPSEKDVRKAIQTMFGASLPSHAVRVQRVNASESAVEASAEIQAVFRAKSTDGHWRLNEVRTGQDAWERLDLIAQALGAKLPSGSCDAPGSQLTHDLSSAKMTTKRARCLVAELFGVTLPSDQVRIKDLSSLDLPFGSESSALIESTVQLDFRLERDNGGWRVSEIKSGSGNWAKLDTFSAALNEAKRANATTDLAAIANALADFRRARGSFVVSDKESVLIDHLSPQYLTRVIRVDPWHRPYQYEGEQNRFSLRSLGPDGKPNTPDDVVISGPTP